MTMPPDLPVRACPFCAAPGLVSETLDFTWYAMCSDDTCAVIPRYFPTQAEALKVWNRRPVAEVQHIVPESTIIGMAA